MNKETGDSKTRALPSPEKDIMLTGYPVGHKAHSVRTVSGVPMATIITAASVSDQNAILLLLDELMGCSPTFCLLT